MAGSREKTDLYSEFWCIRCGKKGIPVRRKRSGIREKGHRKKLYCIYCRQQVNHVETRNEEEARQFREDFGNGKYKEEAN